MKKYNFILHIFLIFALSPMAHALDGQGTIKTVMSCSAGPAAKGIGWKQILLFQLSDSNNWFGVFSDWKGAARDYDSNFATSLVLMAFSSNLPVTVKANFDTRTYCGKPAAMFWDKANDYIKIKK